MTVALQNLWDMAVGPFAEFSFMRRALVATMALSISAAPLGVFLALQASHLLSLPGMDFFKKIFDTVSFKSLDHPDKLSAHQ